MTVKHHEYIRTAFERGYRMDELTGEVISPDGNRRTLKLYGNQRYPSFTITAVVNGVKKSISFQVHKFAAYCYYGNAALNQHVRHLDADTLNIKKSNIALGSASDNEMDKPKHVRVATAKAARASQDKSPACKLSREDVDWIKSRPQSTRKMAVTLGVSRSTIQQVLLGKTYAS